MRFLCVECLVECEALPVPGRPIVECSNCGHPYRVDEVPAPAVPMQEQADSKEADDADKTNG